MDDTDAQGRKHEMVQVMHAEWVHELRDVKNELKHVRELVAVLVRTERCAETKAEIAARRLDRMEREQHEADDAEHDEPVKGSEGAGRQVVRRQRAMASGKPEQAKSCSSTRRARC